MDYKRAIYLIGKSHRQLRYNDGERGEIASFIMSIAAMRPDMAQCVRFDNLCAGLAMQSDMCLGKNLLRIWRQLKYRPLSINEETVCKRLAAIVNQGRIGGAYFDGLLTVDIYGIETGLLKVLVNGISTGFLKVNVDGVETGQVHVAIKGIKEEQQ